MIWSAIRTAIYVGLGAVQLAVDVCDSLKRVVRKLAPRRPPPPKEPHDPR